MRLTLISNKAGFTLIEMLVVMGIVTVMVALLLPALSRARRAAEQVVCVSNVRQVVMCDLLYATDNKGILCPLVASGPNADVQTMHGVTGPVYLLWFASEMESIKYKTDFFDWRGGYLGKYFQTEKILQCPSLKLEVQPLYGYTDYPIVNYSPNGHLSKAKLSQVTMPSETVAFADVLECSFYTYDGANRFQWPSVVSNPSASFLQAGSVFQGRHLQNRGGVGFLDGHAELIPVAMRALKTYSFRSSPGTLLPSTYQAYLGLHLGELIPPNMKITDTSPSSYNDNAGKLYDYYFWINKSKRSF